MLPGFLSFVSFAGSWFCVPWRINGGSESLFPGSRPFCCLLWSSYAMDEAMHDTSSSSFSEESGDNSEHNVWNLLLCALCHFEIGKVMENFLEDVSLGRCALTCHFALDSQCEQT